MKNFLLILIAAIYLLFNINSFASQKDFFNEAMKLYNKKNFKESKIFFEKDIVYNPKSEKSYLYLAKIYNHEENQKKEEKNLETSLLIEPNNEEAILMSMKLALVKSNYSKVKDLSNTFKKVCKNLCNENKNILKTLSNIEPKNDSWSKFK